MKRLSLDRFGFPRDVKDVRQSARRINLSSRLVKTFKSLSLSEEGFHRCRLFIQDLKEDCQSNKNTSAESSGIEKIGMTCLPRGSQQDWLYHNIRIRS